MGGHPLLAALEREHRRDPFRPSAPRDAATRVLAIAGAGGHDPQLVRGGVDVGPAEIDHLWVRLDGRVLDVALPLLAPGFLSALRAWVAGDVGDDQLDDRAAPFGLGFRVLEHVPDGCRYRGRPVLHHRRPR